MTTERPAVLPVHSLHLPHCVINTNQPKSDHLRNKGTPCVQSRHTVSLPGSLACPVVLKFTEPGTRGGGGQRDSDPSNMVRDHCAALILLGQGPLAKCQGSRSVLVRNQNGKYSRGSEMKSTRVTVVSGHCRNPQEPSHPGSAHLFLKGRIIIDPGGQVASMAVAGLYHCSPKTDNAQANNRGCVLLNSRGKPVLYRGHLQIVCSLKGKEGKGLVRVTPLPTGA